jgi:hypothetical protein
MGRDARLNRPYVMVICPDQPTQRKFAEMLERISGALSAFDDFTAFMTTLDDDASEVALAQQVGPELLNFTTRMMLLYGEPGQFNTDIQSLEQVQIREGGRG